MHPAVVLLVCVAVTAGPAAAAVSQRIIGGDGTTINEYPFAVALLYSREQSTFAQKCVGSILNQRSVLTAAHCFWNAGMNRDQWRSRVGSTYSNSGGTVHTSAAIINHPQFDPISLDNDVSILQVTTYFQYIANTVAPAAIAGQNYLLNDNVSVQAIGWGATEVNGPFSEQLNHVELWTVNNELCKERYSIYGYKVTDNMLCAGFLNVGGRDQCTGDSGGAVLYQNIIFGICSWGQNCADSYLPGVNVYIPSVSFWIQNNA